MAYPHPPYKCAVCYYNTVHVQYSQFHCKLSITSLNSLGTSAVVLGHLQALREAMEGLGGCDLATLSTSTTAILQLVEGTGNHSDTWSTKTQNTQRLYTLNELSLVKVERDQSSSKDLFSLGEEVQIL